MRSISAIKVGLICIALSSIGLCQQVKRDGVDLSEKTSQKSTVSDEKLLRKIVARYLEFISRKPVSIPVDTKDSGIWENLDPCLREKINQIQQAYHASFGLFKEASENGIDLPGAEILAVGNVPKDLILHGTSRRHAEFRVASALVSSVSGLVVLEIFYPGDEDQKVWEDIKINAELFFYKGDGVWRLCEIVFREEDKPDHFWTLSSNLSSGKLRELMEARKLWEDILNDGE